MKDRRLIVVVDDEDDGLAEGEGTIVGVSILACVPFAPHENSIFKRTCARVYVYRPGGPLC